VRAFDNFGLVFFVFDEALEDAVASAAGVLDPDDVSLSVFASDLSRA
jgi:hypothetical protein